MNDVDVAWVAGILEGEGSFFLKEASKFHHERNAPYVKCSMTDEDVIRRLHGLVGFGTVYTALLKSGSTIWTWHSGDRDAVPELLRRLHPWMGERRRKQIDIVLAGAAPYGYKARSVRPRHRLKLIG